MHRSCNGWVTRLSKPRFRGVWSKQNYSYVGFSFLLSCVSVCCVCVKFCVHELQVTQLERIIIFCGYVEQHESVFLNFFRLILSNICNQEVEFWLIDVAGLSFVAKQAAFDGVNLDEHVLIV